MSLDDRADRRRPCRSGPAGEIAARIASRFLGSSGLTLKEAGSGLELSSLRTLWVLEALLEDRQRLGLGDELDRGDVRNRFQLALQGGDLAVGRVVVEKDLELDLRAHLRSLLPCVVWKTGISTPSRITVTTVVTIAAMLGAALRRRARNASWMKKKSLDIRRACRGCRGRWSGPRGRRPSRPASAGRTRWSTPRCSRR